MTKKDLLELIRKTLQEYTGTGASGGNAGDGNSITAPGIPYDDEEAIERYTNKKGQTYHWPTTISFMRKKI